MVTGLEGSINGMSPRWATMIPRGGGTFHYADRLTMMSSATYGYCACAEYCPV